MRFDLRRLVDRLGVHIGVPGDVIRFAEREEPMPKDRAMTKAPFNKRHRQIRNRIASASRAANRRPKGHRRHRVHA